MTCHASIHAGALVVEGDPIRGLIWNPAALDLSRAVRGELEKTRRLAQVRVVEVLGVSGILDSEPLIQEEDGSKRVQVSACRESVTATVLQALERLGWTCREAWVRLERAASRYLAGGQDLGAVPLAEVLLDAIRG